MATEIEQATVDMEHLRLLAIFHYVVGGLHLLFGCFFLAYFLFMLFLMSHSGMFPPHSPHPVPGQPAAPDVAVVFRLMSVVMGFFVLFAWTLGSLTVWSGRCLARRTRKTFSTVMAAINCLSLPFGTILGVFTLVVLTRESVRRLYAGMPAPPTISAPTP